MANPERLERLDLLAQGERSVDPLSRSAGLQTSTASAHLQTLHQAGLVDRRRDEPASSTGSPGKMSPSGLLC